MENYYATCGHCLSQHQEGDVCVCHSRGGVWLEDHLPCYDLSEVVVDGCPVLLCCSCADEAEALLEENFDAGLFELEQIAAGGAVQVDPAFLESLGARRRIDLAEFLPKEAA